MYNKILVSLDGSKLSEGVLPYARTLARCLAIPVELLYVNNPEDLAPYVPPLQGADYLAKVAKTFSSNVAVTRTVELGAPPAVIVDLTVSQPQALIAMATHGRSGAKRWLLGSVAEKVLHAVKNHLLLVRPAEEDRGEEARLTSAIVPLDGSGVAEKVLPAISALAPRLDLEIVLVRVTERVYTAPPEAFLPVFGAVPNLNDLSTQAQAQAAEYLTGRVEHLRVQGISNVSSLVLEAGQGGAAAEIIDLAKQTADNFVAMSTHGASGIGRWFVGSVTERVVRHSSDPVLVIPAAA